MIIGLTGGIGSGKSTVARMFYALGIEVIDADQLTQQLVKVDQPALKSIIHHFGETLVSPDGSLNKAKLSAIIFEFPAERQWLEQLLHPLVETEIRTLCNKNLKSPYTIVEIPLLIEANFEPITNRILVVDCSEALQIERTHARDSRPKSSIQAIMGTQVSRATRLSKAHDVIRNEGTKKELKAKVLTLHYSYTKLSK
jgi:dephospho-CoA kinase